MIGSVHLQAAAGCKDAGRGIPRRGAGCAAKEAAQNDHDPRGGLRACTRLGQVRMLPIGGAKFVFIGLRGMYWGCVLCVILEGIFAQPCELETKWIRVGAPLKRLGDVRKRLKKNFPQPSAVQAQESWEHCSFHGCASRNHRPVHGARTEPTTCLDMQAEIVLHLCHPDNTRTRCCQRDASRMAGGTLCMEWPQASSAFATAGACCQTTTCWRHRPRAASPAS